MILFVTVRKLGKVMAVKSLSYCRFTGSRAILSGPAGGVVSKSSQILTNVYWLPSLTAVFCLGWLCSDNIPQGNWTTSHWFWHGRYEYKEMKRGCFESVYSGLLLIVLRNVHWCVAIWRNLWACVWDHHCRSHHSGTTGIQSAICWFLLWTSDLPGLWNNSVRPPWEIFKICPPWSSFFCNLGSIANYF